MRMASTDRTTGTSALMLATGLAAIVCGVYLVLWELPMRLVVIIFAPAVLPDGAWTDVAAYALSWVTLFAGAVLVHRGVRRLRRGSRLDSPP